MIVTYDDGYANLRQQPSISRYLQRMTRSSRSLVQISRQLEAAGANPQAREKPWPAFLLLIVIAAGCSESSTGSLSTTSDTAADGAGMSQADHATWDTAVDGSGMLGDIGDNQGCLGGEPCGAECKNADDCDDLNVCTRDLCQVNGRCIHTTIDPCPAECTSDKDCDDSDPCTKDVCGTSSVCSNSPVAGCGNSECTTNNECADNNPCTDDSCTDDLLCVHKPNLLPCDDGDLCTEGDTCSMGECMSGAPSTTPECAQKPPSCDAMCQLFGNMGTEVECKFQIATDTRTAPPGTALQFVATYDSDRIQFVNFFDEHCFGGAGCFDVPTNGPDSLTLTTGHSVAIAPDSPEKWDGDGAVILVNIADPTLPLSPAYLTDQGTVNGDPVFMRGRFKLLSSVNKSDAVDVCLSKLLAADGTAVSLPTTIQNFLIVTSTPKL